MSDTLIFDEQARKVAAKACEDHERGNGNFREMADAALDAAIADLRARNLAQDGEIWVDRAGAWWNHPNAKEQFARHETLIIRKSTLPKPT